MTACLDETRRSMLTLKKSVRDALGYSSLYLERQVLLVYELNCISYQGRIQRGCLRGVGPEGLPQRGPRDKAAELW